MYLPTYQPIYLSIYPKLVCRVCKNESQSVKKVGDNSVLQSCYIILAARKRILASCVGGQRRRLLAPSILFFFFFFLQWRKRCAVLREESISTPSRRRLKTSARLQRFVVVVVVVVFLDAANRMRNASKSVSEIPFFTCKNLILLQVRQGVLPKYARIIRLNK